MGRDMLKVAFLILLMATPILLIDIFTKRSEKHYALTVKVEYCNGTFDTLYPIVYSSYGLRIFNIKRAVPELCASHGTNSAGYVVAYNVCDFNIISSKRIK